MATDKNECFAVAVGDAVLSLISTHGRKDSVSEWICACFFPGPQKVPLRLQMGAKGPHNFFSLALMVCLVAHCFYECVSSELPFMSEQTQFLHFV